MTALDVEIAKHRVKLRGHESAGTDESGDAICVCAVSAVMTVAP